jgi:hypothetical protein
LTARGSAARWFKKQGVKIRTGESIGVMVPVDLTPVEQVERETMRDVFLTHWPGDVDRMTLRDWVDMLRQYTLALEDKSDSAAMKHVEKFIGGGFRADGREWRIVRDPNAKGRCKVFIEYQVTGGA